jgi:hypothetical protein
MTTTIGGDSRVNLLLPQGPTTPKLDGVTDITSLSDQARRFALLKPQTA